MKIATETRDFLAEYRAGLPRNSRIFPHPPYRIRSQGGLVRRLPQLKKRIKERVTRTSTFRPASQHPLEIPRPNTWRERGEGNVRRPPDTSSHLSRHKTRSHLLYHLSRFSPPRRPRPALQYQHLYPLCFRSTYDPGIYSSLSATFSLSYYGRGAYATAKGDYDGLRLIVCATMMGISAALSQDNDKRNHKEAWAGSNSHVSTNQMEYIVFHRAQIIPCYVIHLDWGIHNDIFSDGIPQNSNK